MTRSDTLPRLGGRIMACCLLLAVNGAAAQQVIDGDTHYVRSGAEREWDEFPERPTGSELVLRFDGQPNPAEQTLRLRQRDVKQVWKVRLNGRDLGSLVQDENEIVSYFAVPAGALREGENELRVSCAAGEKSPPDDVVLGDVALLPRPRADVLSEATLSVEVADSGAALPCRITIADDKGGLVTLGTPSGSGLAVRPGVVYTGNGRATLSLPAGKYTVYAGRGFEYSVDSATVDLKPGDAAERKMRIRRVVDTTGHVACDTHVHTLTYSRHGDALVEERVLTLAGEGVELPVATDHNLQVDYGPAAEKAGVRRYFTPVVGNEVTTASLGHFNVFPILAGAKLINWRGRDWDTLSRSIAETAGNPVVVLNHARDIHGGFRPFDPIRHVSVAGEPLDGKQPPANAMEVVNSGAVQNDPMRLYRDWFGMLNRGHRLTPIGASDSHDVARYVVGQGRTYVQCNDAEPGNIDVAEAARNLLAGRVNVSYGLLCTIKVEGRFRPGDLATVEGDVDIEVLVLGPEWVKATSVTLFANGVPVHSADIATPAGTAEPAGVKWQGRWTLPKPKHDVYLVAIATGPAVRAPYWPTAKPYQPTSSRFEGYVVGSTGAVWVDADGTGDFQPAYRYATRVVEECAGDPARLTRRLADFDEAVAAQAASVLRERSPDKFEETCRQLLAAASPATRRGIESYVSEWKQSAARPK